MTVSVIIPTYNGAHKILRVLAALEQQTYVPDEVIVVIDGSTDTTAQVLKSNAFNFPQFKVIDQENKGRAAVRNRGAREAKGDILVFFDDDMRPTANCLAEHMKHQQQNPDSLAVGYQVEDVSQLTTDFHLYKESLSKKWFNSLACQETPRRMQVSNLFITAANFSLPRHMFIAVGGFDDSLRDIEDFDLGMRAMELGMPIFFIENAIAWHDDFVTCASYIKRLREYRLAHNILRQHRLNLYDKYMPKSVQLPTGMKAGVFKLFALPVWGKLVDKEYFSILPKPLRYKLYDVITTAQGVYYID